MYEFHILSVSVCCAATGNNLDSMVDRWFGALSSYCIGVPNGTAVYYDTRVR